MRIFYLILLTIFTFTCIAIGEEQSIDSTWSDDTMQETTSSDISPSDTLVSTEKDRETTPSEESSEVFKNPFIETDLKESKDSSIEDSKIADVTNSTEATLPDSSSQQERDFPLDLLIDLSIGANMNLLMVEPNYISTEGKANFYSSAGIIVPFGRWFYAGVSVCFMKLSCDFHNTDTAYVNGTFINKTTSEELLTFISAPIKIGVRFDAGTVAPYFYAEFEPAYLASSYLNAKEESEVTYIDDGPKQFFEKTTESETTMYRERHQIFLGGGAGIEISYGYGAVYINAGCNYSMLDEGNEKSKPLRNKCRILHFPVSIGVRFFI